MEKNVTPRFYRVRDLQVIFDKPTVKATRSVYREPGFPEPIKIGREYLWPVDAVERFIAERAAGRVTRRKVTASRSTRPADVDASAHAALPLIRIGRAA